MVQIYNDFIEEWMGTRYKSIYDLRIHYTSLKGCTCSFSDVRPYGIIMLKITDLKGNTDVKLFREM